MALSYNRTYVENQSTGKALEGVVVRVYKNGVLQSVFADESSTPLPTVLTIEDGSAIYYVDGDGVYEEEYIYNGDILDRVKVTIFNPANYAPGADVDAILGAPAVDGDLGLFTSPLIADNVSTKAAIESIGTNLATSGGAAFVNTKQSGVADVARTQLSKNNDLYHIRDAGVVGDGVTNDTVAFQRALDKQLPLDFGGLTVRIASAVSQTVTSDVLWQGKGATIIYDGAHVECAVNLTTATGNKIEIDGITVDGANLANIPFRIRSTGAMSVASNLRTNNLFVKRAKRSAAFSGVSSLGFLVEGSFDLVYMRGGKVSDCQLPAGTGTPSAVGVAGITVSPISTDKWARRFVVDSVEVEKIYSVDLAYQFDQDGLGYFAPNDATHPSGKVESTLVVMGNCKFNNCYGRSIKTQCRNTVLLSGGFYRTEGLSSLVGNGEIQAQAGSLTAGKLYADYKNGYQPGVFAAISCDLVAGKSALNVDDVEIYLETGTTLGALAQAYASTGIASQVTVENFRIFGKTQMLLDYAVNGDDNNAVVQNGYVEEIAVSTLTGDRAAVYVRKAGATATAKVQIENVTELSANSPSVARTQIAGGEMVAQISARNNPGFSNVLTAAANPAGLNTKQSFIVPVLAGEGTETFKFTRRTGVVTIAAGATAVIPVRKSGGSARIYIAECGAAGNGNSFIHFNSSYNKINTTLTTGPNFTLGDAADPGAGAFRVWSSGGGGNSDEISLKNTEAGSLNFAYELLEIG